MTEGTHTHVYPHFLISVFLCLFQMAAEDSETSSSSSPLLPTGRQQLSANGGVWRWRRREVRTAPGGNGGSGGGFGAMRMRLRSLLAAAVAISVCALVFTSGLLARDGLVDSRSPSPLRGFGDALNRAAAAASSPFAVIGRGTEMLEGDFEISYCGSYNYTSSCLPHLQYCLNNAATYHLITF